MRIRVLIARAFVLVGLGVMVTRCGEVEAPGKRIVFASVYNLTGFQAVLDVPSSNGSIVAASEINANGGVLGPHVAGSRS